MWTWASSTNLSWETYPKTGGVIFELQVVHLISQMSLDLYHPWIYCWFCSKGGDFVLCTSYSSQELLVETNFVTHMGHKPPGFRSSVTTLALASLLVEVRQRASRKTIELFWFKQNHKHTQFYWIYLMMISWLWFKVVIIYWYVLYMILIVWLWSAHIQTPMGIMCFFLIMTVCARVLSRKQSIMKLINTWTHRSNPGNKELENSWVFMASWYVNSLYWTFFRAIPNHF